MAETVSFIRRADGGTTNISTLEVYNGTSTLSMSGWQPQVMGEDDISAIETMRFRVNGTSDNHIATITQGLAQKVREVRWSKEPAERYYVWLNDQYAGETNARQAPVFGMKVESGNFLHGYPTRNHHIYEGLTLAVERGHWENPSGSTFTGGSTNCCGGTFSVGTVPGDVSARLNYFAVTSAKLAVESWWGFKSGRNVTLANWTPVWESELAHYLSATETAAYADVTCSGGSAVRCNFSGTQPMYDRLNISPFDIAGANFADLRGSYQILARAKVDSGYSCRYRLGYGFSSSDFSFNEPVTVSGTAWLFYDMGRVTIPCGGHETAAVSAINAVRNSQLSWQAELYTGTQGSATYAYLDCFVAIPIDEGSGHYSGADVGYAQITIDPLGRVHAYQSESGTAAFSTLPTTTGTNARDTVVPVGSVVCAFAANGIGVNAIADTADISGSYYPRWQMLRGAA
jgi:hypothetical protein